MSDEYTKQVLRSMMTENTGISFLDSGGRDRRAWQQNRKLVAEEGDSAFDCRPQVLGFRFNEGGDWDGVVDVYHYLLDNFVASRAWNRLWRMFDNQDGENYSSYDETIKAFCRRVGLKIEMSEYTYGTDSFLSQNVIWYGTVWVRGKRQGDGGPTIIQLHNGADARGGFTGPRFFEPQNGDSIYFDPGIYLCCDGSSVPVGQMALVSEWTGSRFHEWHTAIGWTKYGEFESVNGNLPALSEYEFVFEPDDDWLYQNGYGNGRLVIREGTPHCPVCGGALSPYMEV